MTTASTRPIRPVGDLEPTDPEFRLAAVDLYRDIHKGIRAELFAITSLAGNIDPSNEVDRTALADHVCSIAGVLAMHADHEDSVLDPVLDVHAPDLAAHVSGDHERLESSFAHVVDLAQSAVEVTGADQRRLAQLLHLDLASFTAGYLAHQDLEERTVMPILDEILGPERCAALHEAIIGSIPPDELARSLAFMLPAMNVDDRAEMLGGIRMAAPPEAFDHVMGLARSVLEHTDFDALAVRLQVER